VAHRGRRAAGRAAQALLAQAIDAEVAALLSPQEKTMSTVSVTIDYSNGAQKHFSSVPWNEGLTILGGIEACAKIPPGITITFGSDRSGHAIGLVIDGIGRGDAEGDWAVWVNAKPFADRHRTETSFGFNPGEREKNLLKSCDHILVKRSQ